MEPVVSATSTFPQGSVPKNQDRLWTVAQQLEASFLTEMLGSAGFGATRQSFGGGIGEDQFGSFLRKEVATEMVKSGGIGLAESIFDALKDRSGA